MPSSLARTGLRLGECLALQIGLHDDGDLDFITREINVARALSDDGATRPVCAGPRRPE